jgi:hypothetical protein
MLTLFEGDGIFAPLAQPRTHLSFDHEPAAAGFFREDGHWSYEWQQSPLEDHLLQTYVGSIKEAIHPK